MCSLLLDGNCKGGAPALRRHGGQFELDRRLSARMSLAPIRNQLWNRQRCHVRLDHGLWPRFGISSGTDSFATLDLIMDLCETEPVFTVEWGGP